MDMVLSDLKWQTCLVYLDDVVVFSATFEQHLRRLKTVFEAVHSAGQTLKPEKYHFGFEDLKFLGHIISHQGVRPDFDKIADVLYRFWPLSSANDVSSSVNPGDEECPLLAPRVHICQLLSSSIVLCLFRDGNKKVIADTAS